MLYIMTLTYTFKVTIYEIEYLENRESLRKIYTNDFHRVLYLPVNWAISNVVMRDLDLNFQVQTFQSSYFDK